MIPAKTCTQRNRRLSHSFRVGSILSFVPGTGLYALAPAIRRVAVRTDQQRNVIVLRSIVDVEHNRHLRIETRDTQRRKIWFSIEDESVSAVGNRTVHQKERLDAPVSVGPCMAQLGPTLVAVLHFKRNGDTTCGRASGSVEYVR